MKRDPFPCLGVRDLLGVPGGEEPVFLKQKLLSNAGYGQAAGHGFVNHVLGESLPPGTIHHGGRHVIRRDQRIER